MRASGQADGLAVHAVAGNNVVLLGMDLDAAGTDGLLGFAIERTDHTEGEKSYLSNALRFPGAPEGDTGSDTAPIQTFRWGDYSAKPDHDYTYRVAAMTGRPGALTPAQQVELAVSTEGTRVGDHTVVFNRGAASSQLYARRFGNRRPEDVPGDAAWRWLSRGLEESLVAFIGQARDKGWALRG